MEHIGLCAQLARKFIFLQPALEHMVARQIAIRASDAVFPAQAVQKFMVMNLIQKAGWISPIRAVHPLYEPVPVFFYHFRLFAGGRENQILAAVAVIIHEHLCARQAICFQKAAQVFYFIGRKFVFDKGDILYRFVHN